MNNLTANQIILLFQFYTGETINPSHTFVSDLEALLQRELVYFPKFKSFEITTYGKNYCQRIINETERT